MAATAETLTVLDRRDRTAEDIDRLHRANLVLIRWALGARTRAPASLILDLELQEVVAESIRAARSLGRRLSELGAGNTTDLRRIPPPPPTPAFEAADDHTRILGEALAQLQRIARAYIAVIGSIGDLDPTTHDLLSGLLRANMARQMAIVAAIP